MIGQGAEKGKLQPVLSGGSYLFHKDKKKPQTPTAGSASGPAFKPSRKVISQRNTPKAEAARKFEQREKFSRADASARSQKQQPQQSTVKISNIVWSVGATSQQSLRGQTRLQERDRSAKNSSWSSQSRSRKQTIQEALQQKISSKLAGGQAKPGPGKKSRSPLTICTGANDPAFLAKPLAKKPAKAPASCRPRDESAQKQYRSYQASPSFVSSFESLERPLEIDQRTLR